MFRDDPEQKAIIEVEVVLELGELVTPTRSARVEYVLKLIYPGKLESKASTQQIGMMNLKALSPWRF